MTVTNEGSDVFQTMSNYAELNFDPAISLVVAQGILFMLENDPDMGGIISGLHIKQQKAVRAMAQSFETNQSALLSYEKSEILTNLSICEIALNALKEELDNSEPQTRNNQKPDFNKYTNVTQLAFALSDIISQHHLLTQADIIEDIYQRQMNQGLAEGEEPVEPVFVDPAAAHNPRLTAAFSYAALVYLNDRYKDFIHAQKPQITEIGLKRLTGVFDQAAQKWAAFTKGQNYKEASQENICEVLRQTDEQMRELSSRSAMRGFYAFSFLANEIGKMASDFVRQPQELSDAYAEEQRKIETPNKPSMPQSSAAKPGASNPPQEKGTLISFPGGQPIPHG